MPNRGRFACCSRAGWFRRRDLHAPLRDPDRGRIRNRRRFSIHPIAIGSGSLLDECIATARSLAGKVVLTIQDEVPFGEPFLRFIRGFDAMLVPSLSDEQPRIAYEAFSQAVPIIGSETGGIREVVESGVDGRLSAPNDVAALTESILWAGRNRLELREMGLRGLESVRHMTHGAMHRNRHKLLRQAFDRR